MVTIFPPLLCGVATSWGTFARSWPDPRRRARGARDALPQRMPADFLVAPDLTVRAARHGASPGDRPPCGAIGRLLAGAPAPR